MSKPGDTSANRNGNCGALYDAILAAHPDEARALQMKLFPLNQAVTARWSLPGLKAALDELPGYYGGPPRLPLRSLGDEARKELRQIMKGAAAL